MLALQGNKHAVAASDAQSTGSHPILLIFDKFRKSNAKFNTLGLCYEAMAFPRVLHVHEIINGLCSPITNFLISKGVYEKLS